MRFIFGEGGSSVSFLGQKQVETLRKVLSFIRNLAVMGRVFITLRLEEPRGHFATCGKRFPLVPGSQAL